MTIERDAALVKCEKMLQHIRMLERALINYAQHQESCNIFKYKESDSDFECTCGLSKICL
jgi:hypothetical protein